MKLLDKLSSMMLYLLLSRSQDAKYNVANNEPCQVGILKVPCHWKFNFLQTTEQRFLRYYIAKKQVSYYY